MHVRNGNLYLTFIGTRCDSHLSFGVDLAPPEWRVGICNGLLEPRASLGVTVLVAVNTIQGFLGRIKKERGRVVAEEALSHIHNGLLGRGCRSFVNDRPCMHTSQNPAARLVKLW